MDIKNLSKIPYCGDLPDLSGEKTLVGAKQLRKALLAGRAKAVYLADNADPAVTGPLEELCRQRDLQPIRVPSMQALGRACGIEVGAAAAAVVD